MGLVAFTGLPLGLMHVVVIIQLVLCMYTFDAQNALLKYWYYIASMASGFFRLGVNML